MPTLSTPPVSRKHLQSCAHDAEAPGQSGGGGGRALPPSNLPGQLGESGFQVPTALRVGAQVHCPPYAILPAMIVVFTFTLRIASGLMSKTFSFRMTMSASLPGVMEPFLFS